MSKIKVLFVIDTLIIGGAEQVFTDIIELLHNEIVIDVMLITKTEQSQIQRLPKGIRILELNRKNKFSLISFLNCREILSKYDLAHIHLRHTYRYVSIVRKIFNLPLSLIFHDHYGKIEVDQNPPFVFYKWLKPYYYIGVSENLRNWAQTVWRIPKNRTAFLQNLPRFNHGKSIAFSDDVAYKCDLILVGNIKPVKNQSFAIEFCKAVSSSSLELVGRVQDQEYYEDIKHASNVHFNQNIDNPTLHLHKFKFGLCTSVSESGPLVILEYFVAGLPFLSYKTGGIADVLYKYVPQYFLENFEINDWIKRYETLNQNYQRIPAGLIERVLDIEFNRDVYANKLLEIYSKCLKSAS